VPALLGEGSAAGLLLPGYRVLVCWVQLHGPSRLLTLAVGVNSVRDMKCAEAEQSVWNERG